MTSGPLALADYRDVVDLDRPCPTIPGQPGEVDEIAARLVPMLVNDPVLGSQASPILARYADLNPRRLLRALLTVRPPGALPHGAGGLLDRLLATERQQCGTTNPGDLQRVGEQWPATAYPASSRTALWRGDITTLATDAIVNAANDQLLGCFLPFHTCVDNAIHSAAGPHLREDCHTIIQRQKSVEPTGCAKITRGYQLPARFVLHTVGPIVGGNSPTPREASQLAGCYRTCLDLAAEVGTIRSVAFCSISTGVFGYPIADAATVALHSVAKWLAAHPDELDLVVFVAFTTKDHDSYADRIASWGHP